MKVLVLLGTDRASAQLDLANEITSRSTVQAFLQYHLYNLI